MSTSNLSTFSQQARLGANTQFEGELSGKEDLIVEGHVRGRVNFEDNTLIIEESGRVQAQIRAGNIVIRGTVEGNVFASQKATVAKCGRMTGDITAARISIEDGARFKGSVKTEERETAKK